MKSWTAMRRRCWMMSSENSIDQSERKSAASSLAAERLLVSTTAVTRISNIPIIINQLAVEPSPEGVSKPWVFGISFASMAEDGTQVKSN